MIVDKTTLEETEKILQLKKEGKLISPLQFETDEKLKELYKKQQELEERRIECKRNGIPFVCSIEDNNTIKELHEYFMNFFDKDIIFFKKTSKLVKADYPVTK